DRQTGVRRLAAPEPPFAVELRRVGPERGSGLLLDRTGPRPHHDLLQRAAARLAARARVDRYPRGRGRGWRDGRAPDAQEGVVVRNRSLLRWGRRCVLRELQRR